MRNMAGKNMLFQNGLMRHTVIFVGLSAVVMIGSMLIGPGTTEKQLILLAVLLSFFGIPHGALDYTLAKEWLYDRFGRFWALGFVSLYLFAMAIVLAAWFLHATASLAAFLVLTFYHFGKGDSLAGRSEPLFLRSAEFIARGGVVLTFPGVFDQTAVLKLFSYLAPEPGAYMLVQVLSDLAPLCTAALIVCVQASAVRYSRYRKLSDLARGLELLVLAAMFALLPALLAFAIYFNFLHAIRHILSIVERRKHLSKRSDWARVYKTALPVTCATLILGGFAYMFLSGISFDMSQLTRVVFIGIASMTYPHVVVIASAERAYRLSLTKVDHSFPL